MLPASNVPDEVATALVEARTSFAKNPDKTPANSISLAKSNTHPKEGWIDARMGARGATFFGYATKVKRGLLTFPDGWSGLALLTLRLSLAGVLVAAPVVAALPPWVPVVLDVLGLALLIGAVTHVAATVSAACLAGAGALAGGAGGVVLALHGLDAVALALLGAGAYSVDARLFGRRVITLRD